MEGYAFLALTVLFSPAAQCGLICLLLPDVQPACKVEGGRGDTVKTESRPRASLQGPGIQEAEGLSEYISSVSRLFTSSGQTHRASILSNI